MKINEKQLRKVIKEELLSEAVVTTGGGALDREGAYTQSERQDIGNKVRAEFINQATSAGVITPEDSWALDLYIGPKNIKISRLQGSLGPPNKPSKKTIKQIARSIANNTSILNRTTLQGFRGLEVAMSNSGSSARAADVKPGGTSRSGGGGRRRSADPCIIELQKAINSWMSNEDDFVSLDTDGIIGPKTIAAYAAVGGKEDLKAYRRGDPCPGFNDDGKPGDDPDLGVEDYPIDEREYFAIDCREIERQAKRLTKAHKDWRYLMTYADANPDSYWDEEFSTSTRSGGKQAADWNRRDIVIVKAIKALRSLVIMCNYNKQEEPAQGLRIGDLALFRGPNLRRGEEINGEVLLSDIVESSKMAQQTVGDFMSSFLDNPKVNQGKFSPGGGTFDFGDASPGRDYLRLKKACLSMVNALSDSRRSVREAENNPIKTEVEVAGPPAPMAESNAKNIINFLKVIY